MMPEYLKLTTTTLDILYVPRCQSARHRQRDSFMSTPISRMQSQLQGSMRRAPLPLADPFCTPDIRTARMKSQMKREMNCEICDLLMISQ